MYPLSKEAERNKLCKPWVKIMTEPYYAKIDGLPKDHLIKYKPSSMRKITIEMIQLT